MSVTQASRALNGHSDVADATKERAAKAASKIGYVPNLSARRLKSPNVGTGTIGLILAGETLRFSDPFFGELLSGIVQEAGQNKLELQMSTSSQDEDPTHAYESAILHKRVDGFVVVRTTLDDPRIRFLREKQYPFVAFGRLDKASDFPAVDESDDAMLPAVDHLVSLGHRQIACISEPARFSKATFRLRSFFRATKAHGLTVSKDDVIEAGFHEDSGYECAKALLTRANPPTAIVSLNDLLALGALRAALDLGLEVPRDLSLTGFDDIEAARLISPGLTTLRQDAHEIGSQLIQHLIPSIKAGAPRSDQVLIKPELVIRESTGPVPT